ncbi:MAG: branched-chain-amino-acid transaminase [Myxococcota bacterium]|nr:branched-chain-amino-acid transaminase [Myxococcota bacterium]
MKVWIDGEIVEGEEARIPVLDHGFLYGDGIFEGIRISGGRVFRLDDHLKRLGIASRCIGLPVPGGLEKLREIVLETARAHGQPEAYCRLIVSRGVGSLGVDPTTCSEPRVVCIVDAVRIYPEEKLRTGISMITSSFRRAAPDVLDPRVKSLNYMTSVLAKQEARRQGADEALLLNHDGHVAEASVANVFAVRSGVLLTPPATDGALEGITRRSVLQLAVEAGIPAGERSLGRFDLMGAAEVFLTGSGAGIVPVGSLDGQPTASGGVGPVTEQITERFRAFAAENGPEF